MHSGVNDNDDADAAEMFRSASSSAGGDFFCSGWEVDGRHDDGAAKDG